MANTSTSIRLRVALHADLRKYLPAGQTRPMAVEVENGTDVAALLARLGIPADETVTVGVNGDLAAPGLVLHDGDEVTMFSQMEGG
ncbi:MAG: MoaD/ThiS family protein [Dehalococcoidia bacterium]